MSVHLTWRNSQFVLCFVRFYRNVNRVLEIIRLHGLDKIPSEIWKFKVFYCMCMHRGWVIIYFLKSKVHLFSILFSNWYCVFIVPSLSVRAVPSLFVHSYLSPYTMAVTFRAVFNDSNGHILFFLWANIVRV